MSRQDMFHVSSAENLCNITFLCHIKCSGINDKCVKCPYAVFIISVLSQFQITITELYGKSLLQYVCVNKNKYVIKADT